jgi:hypothetical protein
LVASGIPAGSNTQVQFNNNGVFGANADFVYNAGSGIVGLPGLVGTGTAGSLFISGGSNQGITLAAGSGTNPGPAPGAGLYGGNTSQLFNGGDVVVQGGNNTAAGAGARGGNVTISGGTSTNATAGTVNISNIATASATATYVPTATTDLTTKTYVDNLVASGIPAGSNTQVQFNNNGVFGADADLTFDPTTNTLSTINFVSTAAATVTPTSTSQLGAAVTTTGQIVGVSSWDAGTY